MTNLQELRDFFPTGAYMISQRGSFGSGFGPTDGYMNLEAGHIYQIIGVESEQTKRGETNPSEHTDCYLILRSGMNVFCVGLGEPEDIQAADVTILTQAHVATSDLAPAAQWKETRFWRQLGDYYTYNSTPGAHEPYLTEVAQKPYSEADTTLIQELARQVTAAREKGDAGWVTDRKESDVHPTRFQKSISKDLICVIERTNGLENSTELVNSGDAEGIFEFAIKNVDGTEYARINSDESSLHQRDQMFTLYYKVYRTTSRATEGMIASLTA